MDDDFIRSIVSEWGTKTRHKRAAGGIREPYGIQDCGQDVSILRNHEEPREQREAVAAAVENIQALIASNDDSFKCDSESSSSGFEFYDKSLNA